MIVKCHFKEELFKQVKQLNLPYVVLKVRFVFSKEKIILIGNVTKQDLLKFNFKYDIINNEKMLLNDKSIIDYIQKCYSEVYEIFKIEYPHGSYFSKNQLRYIKIYEYFKG